MKNLLNVRGEFEIHTKILYILFFYSYKLCASLCVSGWDIQLSFLQELPQRKLRRRRRKEMSPLNRGIKSHPYYA